jgi:uncharacterized protein YlxW (UPF0749 family)
MSESTTKREGGSHSPANGQAEANGQSRKAVPHKARQQDITHLVEQAERLRTSLHNLLHETSGLVKALKQHRRQSRAIQHTLASLKQLKTLGV